MIAALHLALQLAIVTHAPDTAQTCDAVDVSVAVSAPTGDVPRLVVPSLAPFDLLRASATQTDAGNGRIYEYRFTIATARSGTFVIPAFSAVVGGTTLRSNAQVIAIRQARIRAAPAVVARARMDTSAVVSLASLAPAETVYVGQQATYEVAVFLNQTARERLRRNPTFYPPDMQAMLAYDLPPTTSADRQAGSQCFDALVYRRALFPLIPGRLVIPPAQLVYSIALTSTSLFSREESHELQTDSVSIVAIDPPLIGRPAEFTGAVGTMRVASQIDSASPPPRVGDPLLYTVRVEGTGNVKLFARPTLAIPWASVVTADERVRVDSTSTRVSGAKEFDWVLTPRIAGEFDLPPVRYGYFDPSRARYDVAETAPQHVSVAAGALASGDTSRGETALPIRMRYRGESGPPFGSRPVFWLLLAIAPVPALVARTRRRATVRRATARVADPVRGLLVAVGDPANDARSVRRHYVRVLAHRLGCSPEDFTHAGALDRALRRAGVSPGTATRAEQLLRDLDAAAYADDEMRPDSGQAALAIVRAVDREALSRGELPFWIAGVALALVLGAPIQAADPAASHFARGVSAYVRGDFAAARDAFATAATIVPQSADAWANYGTAAWAVSDTAAAVYGWREAVSLEPDADDVQQRLTLPHDFGTDDPGWVPAIPRDAPAAVVLLLWIAAWSLALARARTHAWARRWPLPLAACAMLLGLVAIELQTRVSGRHLAVVRHEATLVSDPALGLDRGPSVSAGEVVRVLGRRGVWTLVTSAASREGWVPSSELLAIADRRAPSSSRQSARHD